MHLVRHHLVAGDAEGFGEHGHPGIGHGVAQLRRDRGLHPLPLKVDPDPTGNVEEYRLIKMTRMIKNENEVS